MLAWASDTVVVTLVPDDGFAAHGDRPSDMDQSMNETTDATAIFAPLWRRKWLILAAGVLVAALTYGYYRHKPTVYTASTQLYVGSSNEEQSLLANATGRTTLNERALSDQAALINSNVIGESVRRRLRAERDLAAAAGKAHAATVSGSDFITIATEAHTGKAVAQLANAFAQAYIANQHADYKRVLRAAIARARQQLRRIEVAQGGSGGARRGRGSSGLNSTAVIQAAALNSKINQLESDLSVAGVEQISPAKPKASILVAPKPRRSAIFGFLLGVFLAACAAYAASRFDRRLRSLADVESALRAQVLAALPSARPPIVRRDGLPTPAATLLEPLRRLHTTLQLGDMLEHDRERAPRVILFVSADAGDGKSTVVADLALVQRDAGERVAVVEADLRRPVLAGLLDVGGAHGLAEVLAGALPVAAAMQQVASVPGSAGAGVAQPAAGMVAVAERGAGSLSVLLSGRDVANPPALLASRTMAELLRSLAEEYDYVLVDAPPPLGVSDVMPLLHAVDGIVLVARVGHTRETSARQLLQFLARASSAPVLGIVANGVSHTEMKAYGFASAYEQRRWPKLTGR
jgi:Mrp family chromosome partitioning ATPase/capsular polysaccharide biosynthesis protein